MTTNSNVPQTMKTLKYEIKYGNGQKIKLAEVSSVAVAHLLPHEPRNVDVDLKFNTADLGVGDIIVEIISELKRTGSITVYFRGLVEMGPFQGIVTFPYPINTELKFNLLN